LAHPGASAGAAGGPAGPTARGGGRRGTALWRDAHTPARGEGLTARTATEGGGRPEFDRRWNSAAVLRRGSGSAAGRQWRGTGGGRGSQGWGQFDRRGPRAAGPWRGGGCSWR
jgi:hypothetical protein